MEINEQLIAEIDQYTEEIKIKINSQESLMIAAENLKSIKSKYKQIEDQRLGMTRSLDKTKKKIMDFFRIPLDALSKAEAEIKKDILRYQQQEAEKQKIAEELAFKEAREKEDQERGRLLTISKEALASGDVITSQSAFEEANNVYVVAEEITTDYIPPAGVSVRKAWKYKIEDEKLIPREYLVPNGKALATLAVATKGSLKIPGIIFYSEDILSVRS